MPKLHIYKNERETCTAFAEWMVALIKEVLETKEIFTLALSGGETPKQVYKILVTDYAESLDWNKVHIFWGDERMVAFADEKNNANVAVQSFIEHVNIPRENVHIIPTDKSPEECAADYEAVLRKYFEEKDRTFDLVIIGMSEDGAIMSLMPDNEESLQKNGWVISVFNPEENLHRITLTTTVINDAAARAFLITGKRKEDVVQKVLNGKYDPERYPAQLIQSKPIDWFMDESAAAKIIKPAS